jgi:hypothetical protein
MTSQALLHLLLECRLGLELKAQPGRRARAFRLDLKVAELHLRRDTNSGF